MLLVLWTSAFLFSAVRYSTNTKIPRDTAKEIIDEHLLPKHEYGKRIEYGRDAQGLPKDEDVLIRGDDPVLSFTYGEFPLHGTDLLLDIALKHLTTSKRVDGGFEFVDVGSGCGRLCLYLAMTRSAFRTVRGIEIAEVLHREALRARDAAVEGGWLANQRPRDSVEDCCVSLHHGPADAFSRTLEGADLVFCYSTAWETSGFSTDISALVLSDEWNELFSTRCKPGCIVVTTDRALDPRRGWALIDRIDVSNPEVFESTGFIQQMGSSS